MTQIQPDAGLPVTPRRDWCSGQGLPYAGQGGSATETAGRQGDPTLAAGLRKVSSVIGYSRAPVLSSDNA